MCCKSSNISRRSTTDSLPQSTPALLAHFFSSNLEPIPVGGGSTSVIFARELDAWLGKLVQPIGQTIKDSVGEDIAFKKPNFE